MSVTFLSLVNDILVRDGIISDNDDEITSFSSTQHAAAIRLAKAAVQVELAKLNAMHSLPYEQAEATLTTVASTRTYSLATDFVRFRDPNPFLLEVDSSGDSENIRVWLYPGGEDALRRAILDYREQSGTAIYFYPTTGQSIGLYPVPDAVKRYRYLYQKSVTLSDATDTLDLTTEQATMLVEICARRFRYMFTRSERREALFPQGLDSDPIILDGRGALIELLRHDAPVRHYGRRFLSCDG